MSEVLQVLAKLLVVVAVVSGMLAIGLSLTVGRILEPLRNVGLVLKALLANFVLVPLAALLIQLAIPLSQPLTIGLILLATAAGAPFLPRLAQGAKGDVHFGVGLMVLLMVLTLAYVPVVLPLLLPGVEVDPLAIARSLVVLMLIPLAGGLFVKARYSDLAASLQPMFAQASSTSLLAVIVLLVVLNFRTVLGTVGTGAILAALALIVVSFAIGYVLGGPRRETRSVLGLGTAQRNTSAAMVVGSSNFTDHNVLVMVIVGTLLMLVLLLLTAWELGKRQAPEGAVPAGEAVAEDRAPAGS